MALGATVYVFAVELAHSDRGVYESLTLRVARHPSETEDFLLARMLAYCLEYCEGIAFSKGLSDPDEPALSIRDLTGVLQAWIDIGTPDASRLHRAGKVAPRVVVYIHKDPLPLLARLNGERIHRAGELELYTLDRELLASLVSHLSRRMSLTLTVAAQHLYVAVGEETFSGPVERLAFDGKAS